MKNADLKPLKKSSITCLLTLVAAVAERAPNIDIETLQALLVISIKGEMTITDIAEAMGWPVNKASRRAYKLCEPRPPSHSSIKGLSLCLKQNNPNDDRSQLIALSDEGRRLVRTLGDILET